MKQYVFSMGLILAVAAPFVQANPEASAPASASASATASAGDAMAVGKTLVKSDSVIGSGAEAGLGQWVTVNYTGWLYDPNGIDGRGKRFDSSIGREPFTFQLGARQVIKGWDLGVMGMKIGGKRTLIIPADLGYGSRGAGGVIPPNAVLVFDVELLGVR